MSKKITIFTEVFSPEDFRINELVDYLLENNFEITVVTRIPSYPKGIIYPGFNNRYQKEINNNLIIYRYPIFLNYDKYKYRKILNLVWQPIALAIAYLKIRPRNIFIFQTGSIYQYFFIVFLSKSKTIIIWSQDLWPEAGYLINRNFKRFNGLLKYTTRIILKSATKLIVQSQGFYDHYLDVYSIKSTVITNFSTDQLRQEIFSNKNTNLLYAGNIGSAQNLDQLILLYIHINSILPNYFTRFDIYGDGSQFESLRLKYCQHKGIIFHGKISRSTLDEKVIQSKFVCLSLVDSVLNKTIPGRFQYFYNMGCNILYLGNGEVQRLIQNTKCGLVFNSITDHKIKNSLINFNFNNSINRKDIFNKNEILSSLLFEINNCY